MDRYHSHGLDLLCGVLLIIGGLNLLLMGLFAYDVVANILVLPTLYRILYVIIGIAAVYTLVRMPSLYHIGGGTHAPPHTPTSAV